MKGMEIKSHGKKIAELARQVWMLEAKEKVIAKWTPGLELEKAENRFVKNSGGRIEASNFFYYSHYL